MTVSATESHAIANVTETANETGTETVTVSANANVIGTTTGHLGIHALAAMMTATMTARGGIGRKNGSGCTDAALIQVRMTGSPTAMIVPLGRVVVVRKMRMTTRDANREIPRYAPFPFHADTCQRVQTLISIHLQRLKRERTPEPTPKREAARPAAKSPLPPPKDIKSGSEEGEIEEDE